VIVFFTRTFTETRWYQRVVDEEGSRYVEFSPPSVSQLSLDQQVADWVVETGSIIVNPGTLGMHTVWHGTDKDPYAVKCIMLAIVILYQE